MKVMSVTSAILLAVVLVSAEPEPPRFRGGSYGAPSEVEEAPYAPSGWRPSGRQFLLPIRQTYYAPPAAYGTPTTEQATTTTEQPTTTEVPDTTEALTPEFADGNGADPSRTFRERDGQSSGAYHILLPDGRLQRVIFTTSPNQPSGALAANGNPSGAFPAYGNTSGTLPANGNPSSAFPTNGNPSSAFPTNGNPRGAFPAYGAPSQGYVAQVQYQDVEPIQSPIYAFSSPIIRIFK
ncbi:uncharacterized protein LOC110835463 isoform X2 [Zootermopsis nevadensis]|uniref:uncharacterized protein LOC110835463 isoform X2 n=1 Tax=Zootermopsis nevadensis TaxID=136037 RepID=UPI000B8ED54B|nr:uncharacterized protein LOC110835463 isoform X2 [Zootermopsis nevadensis]